MEIMYNKWSEIMLIFVLLKFSYIKLGKLKKHLSFVSGLKCSGVIYINGIF
jgi:hypothetical protein